LISSNDIIARAVSVATSVLLAWLGVGYWALVAGTIALPLTRLLARGPYVAGVPSLPQRALGTGTMLRFATNVYGRWSVSYCCTNMDNLLVGWRFGAPSLGYTEGL